MRAAVQSYYTLLVLSMREVVLELTDQSLDAQIVYYGVRYFNLNLFERFPKSAPVATASLSVCDKIHNSVQRLPNAALLVL